MVFARFARKKSRAKAPLQMIVVHGLGEIAYDTVLHGAAPNDVVRVSCDEDRRNPSPHFDEMLVELDAGHPWHLDVGDQAIRLGGERRFEEIGRRRERRDGVTEQRHELSHGLAKEVVILDDRYQSTFGHRGFPATSFAAVAAAQVLRT